MNKNNSERPVWIMHPLALISTSLLFVFDTEWVMREGDNKLCTASMDAQALGHAASTLAQPIGVD